MVAAYLRISSKNILGERRLLEDILPMALAIIAIYEGTRLAQVALLFDDALGPGWYFFLTSVLFVWVIALLVRQIKVCK
jgi:hypothetical protein